jgi:hypothetical protein
MLPTTSNAIHNSQRENGKAKPAHPGMLSRLLLKFRPHWHADNFVHKPRRAVDRDTQERWPIDWY